MYYSSNCSVDLVTIALHLLFFTTLLFQFLMHIFSKLRRKGLDNTSGSKTTNGYHNTESSPCHKPMLSNKYRAVLACCLLLLISRFLFLVSLLVHGHADSRFHEYCEFLDVVVLSEVMQTLSWTIVLITVFNFGNSGNFGKGNRTKLPWSLRIWWISSFLFSIFVGFHDVYSKLSRQRWDLSIREYVECANFIPYTYLFYVSIRGRTGINDIHSSSVLHEPLLPNEIKEQDGTDGKSCPYAKANIFSLITFSWLKPLLSAGLDKPLDQEDIPDIHIKDSTKFNSLAFSELLREQRGGSEMKDTSLYKLIVLFTWKKAAVNAFFAVTTACASYVGPYLIDGFVKFLGTEKSQNISKGYIMALAFFIAKVIETVAQRQWVFGARNLGMRLRVALVAHIYKKGLRLSSRSRQKHTSGEIINYMSVDIQRITDFMWYVNTIWMLPIQITLAMYILTMNLGKGSFAGLIATFMVMACNIPLTKYQKAYQSKIMEAKDCRMKSTSEILRNIKTIKLQAWDNHYINKVELLRKVEYDWLWKSLRLGAVGAFIFWGAPTFISAATFGSCILLGIPLTAGKVLAALATFGKLQEPIYSLPDLLSVIAQAKVSVDRVAAYLKEEEVDTSSVQIIPKEEVSEFDINVENSDFSWDEDNEHLTLTGIELNVKKGMKIAICGTVGSGKSSLIAAILGEIPKLKGTVKIRGSKAYVPQSPWILTGNVRDNILFGNAFEYTRYSETLNACALMKDMELFSEGDLTEIGERGINMSGGQKQRIQIARAIYQDADIYLLDDPFSAVDAHTGTQLFEECLMGLLKTKTVIYVTHQVEFLPSADLILVMQDGRIAQAGTFSELLQQNAGFDLLVGAHNQALVSISTMESSNRPSHTQEEIAWDSMEEQKTQASLTTKTQVLTGNDGKDNNTKQSICQDITKKGAKLVQDEEREKGSIGMEIYCSYLTAVKRGGFVPLILLAQSSFQVLQVASNYWMAWASPPSVDSEQKVSTTTLFEVYIILAFGSSICVFVRAICVSMAGLLTSQKLFIDMLRSILRAPMTFFDTTPTGRILNRASTDQSVVDLEIPFRLGWCAFSMIQMLGTIVVMSQVAWQVFAIFIPFTFICIHYQRSYTPAARELARLAGIQLAPIVHHFGESLAGSTTIRAFSQEDRFIHGNLELTDGHSRPWFHSISAMEWLSFRLNFLSNIVFAFSLLILVVLPEGTINPSIAGLAITYGLNLNAQLGSIIWNITNAENKMISVERILQYTRISSESPFVLKECRPPNVWPRDGAICIKNLEVRYAEHLPSVLKSISCAFPGKKRIGVVGRTGSGKSTLIQALFRLIEPRQGTIIIDGVDICKIGLHDLRSRLSIIPQDPTMFEGTIRGNMDPLEQYSDPQIWEALDKCQLGHTVRNKAEKLDSPVVENGENWSVGQRQLVCLGRALLKRSGILVLDEATASVDSATDGTIQRIIREEFEDCTVITIAHRIHTIIDSDLVLVLSEGNIEEYDSPAKLLQSSDSSFSKLIAEYSIRSRSFTRTVNAAA